MQLSTYAGDFRAFKALITAQIAGVQVAVTEVDPAAQSDPNTVPVLTTAHGTISQSNAIARYIARSRPEAGLYGQSFFQSGEVDQWIDWGTNNVELPAILSTYWQFGWQAFNFQANKKAIEDLTAAFKTLEAHLLSRTFLVGQRLTLADIVVASQLVYPLKLSLDAAFRAPFPATLRWFSHVTSLPAAAAVVGAIVLCKTAPSAPKGGGAKAEKAEKPKAEKKPKKEKAPKAPKEEEEAAPADADEDTGPTANELLEEQAAAEAAAEAKKENPLDKLPKSSFVLDEWKRQYSNSTSDYFKSMNWFWPEFEKAADGWSLWHMMFNHNDENTVDFVVCNKLEGYIQRAEGLRKYAFGVLQILDTKERLGYYTVGGVWLIRGTDIAPMLETSPEACVYTWTRIDHTDAASRQRVANYWCGEAGIDGENSFDSKVFK